MKILKSNGLVNDRKTSGNGWLSLSSHEEQRELGLLKICLFLDHVIDFGFDFTPFKRLP